MRTSRPGPRSLEAGDVNRRRPRRLTATSARPQPSVRRSFSAGTAHALDRDGGKARLLRDRAVLLLDDRARGLVAIEAAQHRARHLAVGSLRAILVEHVEQHEFSAGSGFLGHLITLSMSGRPNVRRSQTKARRVRAGPGL